MKSGGARQFKDAEHDVLNGQVNWPQLSIFDQQ